MVATPGLEPGTFCASNRRSTNWATSPYKRICGASAFNVPNLFRLTSELWRNILLHKTTTIPHFYYKHLYCKCTVLVRIQGLEPCLYTPKAYVLAIKHYILLWSRYVESDYGLRHPRPPCYHYTIPSYYMAGRYRIELQSTVLETVVIAIIPTPYTGGARGYRPLVRIAAATVKSLMLAPS